MAAINNVDVEGFSRTMVSPPDHLKKDEYRSIRFFSLNLQHCQAAACNARSELTDKKTTFSSSRNHFPVEERLQNSEISTPCLHRGPDQELQ